MNKKDKFYMDIAERVAKESYCNRLKVGAIIVKDDSIISTGYNGTLRGAENNCEEEVNGEIVTNPMVLHAEQNALIFALRHGVSTIGATLYVTHSPCEHCAKLIFQAGIKRIVYKSEYRQTDHLKELKDLGMVIDKYS